ncbi:MULTISPECIES: hypothetical protein [Sporosarcina]|uniref:hypothetical protein n=1 Tax=Sporosarcina TaxID=1569 RepID=UPI00058F9DDD|nr:MULTISPECIES: hypothetical protein [Sporosarcina]WJY28393.1 hypothetical protein QWT68_05270 [Sporosarcina sp. 0.2-SM1T-5]
MMEETNLPDVTKEHLPARTERDVRLLTEQVKELEDEVRELKKDLHAIDLFQKKPVISTDALAISGFWIVAALVVIGIFY